MTFDWLRRHVFLGGLAVAAIACAPADEATDQAEGAASTARTEDVPEAIELEAFPTGSGRVVLDVDADDKPVIAALNTMRRPGKAPLFTAGVSLSPPTIVGTEVVTLVQDTSRTLQRVSLATGKATVLATSTGTGNDLTSALPLAVDTDGTAYAVAMIDRNSNDLVAVDRAGKARVVARDFVVPPPKEKECRLRTLLLDTARIYGLMTCGNAHSEIITVAKSGGSAAVLAATEAQIADAVVADNRIFFSVYDWSSSRSEIRAVPLAGGKTELVRSGVLMQANLAVANGRLYFTDARDARSPLTVASVPLGDPGAQPRAEALLTRTPIALGSQLRVTKKSIFAVYAARADASSGYTSHVVNAPLAQR